MSRLLCVLLVLAATPAWGQQGGLHGSVGVAAANPSEVLGDVVLERYEDDVLGITGRAMLGYDGEANATALAGVSARFRALRFHAEAGMALDGALVFRCSAGADWVEVYGLRRSYRYTGANSYGVRVNLWRD